MLRTSRLPFLMAISGLLLAAPLVAQETTVLPNRDNVLSGQPTALFAVGKDEGESWEMLSNVRAVTFDGRDNLYVLDGGNFRVLAFDASGRFLRQIGKQGNGPGELTFPTGVAIAPDGRVVVADVGRAGYAIFEQNGTYVSNVPTPGNQRAGGLGGAMGAGFFVDASGAAIFRGPPNIALNAGAVPSGPTSSPIIRHALAPNAEPATLYEIPLPAPTVRDGPSPSGQTARMVMFRPQTFAPPQAWAALPNGGIVIAHEPQYAVKVVDANGRLQRIIQRDEKPRAVTRRDQERARTQLREQLSSPGGGQGGVRVTNVNGSMSFSMGGGTALTKDQIEEQVRGMEFAEVMPFVAAVRTDPMSRIWIQRTGREVGEQGVIDLIAADGRYVGTLAGQTLPDAVSATGLAAYIERDELDIQRVAVRRLPAAWMGSQR